MLKHSREEWNDILQKLMNMMEDDYPNNYELVVNSFGAEIRSNLTDMCFTRDDVLKPKPANIDISKLGDTNNKNFDVVEAFHRMLLGRKVRRTDWTPEEWIEYKSEYGIISDERGVRKSIAVLTCSSSIGVMWEEYEEVISND